MLPVQPIGAIEFPISLRMEEYATELKAKRKEADDLEAKLKSVTDSIDQINTSFVELMEENHITELVIPNVGICTYHSTMYPSIKKDMKENVYNELRDIGEGAMIKTVQSVHSKTLQAWVNERIRQNLQVPNGIECFNKREVKIK